MVVRTIIFFFAGMTLLAVTVIVVDTWWVVALVGTTHMVASVALGLLVWRQLAEDERRQDLEDRA